MTKLDELLERNRAWATQVGDDDPQMLEEMAAGQSPKYLWIGCADSRVPASTVLGGRPGEFFVHRNIANVVEHTDLNLLSVMQYAVEVLKVEHIIVCGHYGCGGIAAAMGSSPYGLIDNWLRCIKDVYWTHEKEISAIEDLGEREARMCELNAAAQAMHVATTTIVQQAWKRGQELTVHAWVFRLEDGLIHDLRIDIDSPEQLGSIYQMD